MWPFLLRNDLNPIDYKTIFWVNLTWNQTCPIKHFCLNYVLYDFPFHMKYMHISGWMHVIENKLIWRNYQKLLIIVQWHKTKTNSVCTLKAAERNTSVPNFYWPVATHHFAPHFWWVNFIFIAIIVISSQELFWIWMYIFRVKLLTPATRTNILK